MMESLNPLLELKNKNKAKICDSSGQITLFLLSEDEKNLPRAKKLIAHMEECQKCQDHFKSLKREREKLVRLIPQSRPNEEALEQMMSEVSEVIEKVFIERKERKKASLFSFLIKWSGNK